MANCAIKCLKSFYLHLSKAPPPLINPKTTPSISTTNYSPPSSGNHRSLFVKPAKRGKQRAGGEALFAYHHLTFTYQQHHHLLLTLKHSPPFQEVTTPLSLRRGAGGEALFPSPHLPHHRETFSQTLVVRTSQNTKNGTKVFFS